MKKFTLVAIVVSIFALIAVGCGGAPAPTAAPATTAPQQPAATQPPAATSAPAATQPPAAVATKAPSAAALPYKIGIFSDIKSTNYWAYQGPNNSVWQAYVMAPQRLALYGTADKTFALIPQVAVDLNSPRVAEGANTTTSITLKKGIKWSDGKPVTAKDVAFTANTSLQLQLTGNWPTIFDPAYLDHVEAVDDNTVKFTWKSPPGLARWEWGAAQGPILSEAFWGPVVATAKKSLDGVDKNNKDAYAKALKDAQAVLYNAPADGEPLAGQFLFVKWEKGAFAENKADPDYYAKGAKIQVFPNGYVESKSGVYETKLGQATGTPIVDYTMGPSVSGAIYTIYGTQDAAVLALKKGEIDFMLNPLGLQRGLMNQVQGQTGLAVVQNGNFGFRYLAFNVRKAPMSDIAFRQAMAYMIDKEFITGTILQNVAFPMYTEVPTGNSFWFNKDTPTLGKGLSGADRLAKAVELLKGKGYKWAAPGEPTWDDKGKLVKRGGALLMPDGKPVPALSLIAPSAGYDPLRSTFAIWVERYANDLGVPLKAELIGFNDLITRVYDDPDYAKKLDMYILGWSVTPFPSYLNDFHNSTAAGPGDNNAGGYNNPDFDKLGNSLLTCQSNDECKTIADKLQVMLGTELPYITLFDTGIVETYHNVLSYPYTETLGGLQFISGLPGAVSVNK